MHRDAFGVKPGSFVLGGSEHVVKIKEMSAISMIMLGFVGSMPGPTWSAPEYTRMMPPRVWLLGDGLRPGSLGMPSAKSLWGRVFD